MKKNIYNNNLATGIMEIGLNNGVLGIQMKQKNGKRKFLKKKRSTATLEFRPIHEYYGKAKEIMKS